MTQTTQLGASGFPIGAQSFSDKTPANYPSIGLLVEEFDIWQEGYDGATVSVYYAGTTTLMPIYSDARLTERISNPQILAEKEDGTGARFGKFTTSVYVPFAYELDIDNTQQTGRQLFPLTTLDGEDASNAVVTVVGGDQARSLAARAADFLHAADYGVIGSSPGENNNTLEAAIAAAAAQGGGRILLPYGSVPFTFLTLPGNVFLVGRGPDITVLQSQVADDVIRVTDDACGLEGLTLDGISLLNGSVGITGKNIDGVQLIDTIIKRFQINCFWQGGTNHKYRNFKTVNGGINFRARGDLDVAGGSTGGDFIGLDWQGGEISESTDTGMELYVRDKRCILNTLRKVNFLDNVGVNGALYVYGAQRNTFEGCEFEGNVYDLTVKDNPDTSVAEADRRVSGLHFYGGSINGGTVRFDGLCEDVDLNDMLLDTVTFALSTPINAILVRDSKEKAVTVTGESTKFLRSVSNQFGTARLTTTDATVTTIHRARLAPNRINLMQILITAEEINGADFGVWEIIQAARGAVATLAYDNQTANFTAGNTVVGATSGASATIRSDADGGTAGTLSLANVSGTFLDNEIIAESGGTGSAQANGILVEGSAALVGVIGSTYDAGSNAGALPAGWAAVLAVSGQEVLIKVTGEAAKKIQWDAKINSNYRA